MDSRIVVAIGDIHGCLEEFDELLKTIQFDKSKMRVVLLGDLMDRGPDPIGCVRRAQELGIECIMGNHEEKHLRWKKHHTAFEATGKPIPMKRMSQVDQETNKKLSEQDIVWMKNLPVKIDLGIAGNWHAVHAGCEPRFSLADQDPSQIMRVRYVDENGVAKSLGKNFSAPEGATYWDNLWKGPESIIYGHCVHDLKEPRQRVSVRTEDQWVECVGIDTGCCFGGHLTAAFMHPSNDRFIKVNFKFAQVKAKKIYYAKHIEE